MHIVKTLVNEQLLQAEAKMREGTPDELVSDAQGYLSLLEEYLEKLRNVKGIPRKPAEDESPFARELVEQIRVAVRSAIEHTTNERNRVEALLASFTMVTGWSAVETLNLLAFKAASDWELIGSQVRSVSRGTRMTLNDAVLEAKRMRRERYFDAKEAAQ